MTTIAQYRVMDSTSTGSSSTRVPDYVKKRVFACVNTGDETGTAGNIKELIIGTLNNTYKKEKWAANWLEFVSQELPVTWHDRIVTSFINDGDDAKLDLDFLMESNRSLPESIKKRLRLLYTVSRTEEDEIPLSLSSILGFYRFFDTHSVTRMPMLFVTNDGFLRAEWRESKDRRLIVDFHNLLNCFYMIFTPDPEQPGKIIRASGNSSITQIDNYLCGFQIMSILKDDT